MSLPEAPLREPIFNVPLVVIVSVALLAGVHAYRALLDVAVDAGFVVDWAFIPLRATLAFDAETVASVAGQPPGDIEGSAFRHAMANFLIASDSGARAWTAITYAGLHGGWAHLIVNGLWLLAFGSAVARRIGAGRFVALAVAGAVGGAIAHYLVDTTDAAPLIGASASVSALMGAAARFVFQPGGPFSPFAFADDSAYRVRALGLGELVRERRAFAFLAVWAAMNLAVGLGAASSGIVDASIAWQAHFGGLLVGLLGFPLFERRALNGGG